MAQMVGGVHRESGVEGGRALLPGLSEPTCVIDADADDAKHADAVAAVAGAKGEDPFLMMHAAHAFGSSAQLRSSDPAVSASPVVARATPVVSKATPTPPAKTAVVEADAPMPAGWERRHNAKGRAYYVCHPLRLTQWTYPTAQQIGDSARALKEKQERRAREWAEQQAREAAAAAATTHDELPAVEFHSSDDERTPPGPVGAMRTSAPPTDADDADDDDDDAQPPPAVGVVRSPSGHHVQPAAQPVYQPPAVVLPPGWEARVDPSSGRSFYVDHNTRQTHWTLPPGVGVAAPTGYPPAQSSYAGY
eukprot:TRINITY_DN865_c0_g1_i2.p1 TRINITY_DN865_c0_g1~~TRINITY_DN865_c0_g1_i2.p1  ORF type:complete len:306 (-),score=180.75 TRINITY_DN865_c0_g1_i2:24-941(-)